MLTPPTIPRGRWTSLCQIWRTRHKQWWAFPSEKKEKLPTLLKVKHKLTSEPTSQHGVHHNKSLASRLGENAWQQLAQDISPQQAWDILPFQQNALYINFPLPNRTSEASAMRCNEGRQLASHNLGSSNQPSGENGVIQNPSIVASKSNGINQFIENQHAPSTSASTYLPIHLLKIHPGRPR